MRLLSLDDLKHGFEDDFQWDRDELWTDTADSTGTHALDADGVGGVLQLVTAATDNDGVCRKSPERFKIADDNPLVFEARANFSEANGDDANVLVGVLDAPATSSLGDDGAGPPASYSGAVFFKIDGESRWRVESSIGAAQITHETEDTAGGGWQTLRIIVRPLNSVEAEVEFWIDPNGGRNFHQVREYGSNPRKPPIKHRVTYTGATEMAAAFVVKAGGANAETLEVDKVSAFQRQ